MTNMWNKPTILVVEADPTHLQTTLEVLRNDGYTALGTSDAWEAIRLVSQREVGMVLLDLDLSGLGAMDFAAILSEDPTLKDIITMYFYADCRQTELLGGIRSALPAPLPSEEPSSRSDTRFVRRRRPAAVAEVA